MIRSFGDLIAPLSAEAFLADHQQAKRPGLFRADPRRFDDALNWRTFGDLLNDVARWDSKYRFKVFGADSGEAWFTKPNPLRINRPTLDLTAVGRYISNGHTCVLRDVESFTPGLQAISSAIEKQFGGACMGNLFFSRPHGEPVSPHCDIPDIFVVQLEGRKRWYLLETPAEELLERKETVAEPHEDTELEVLEEHVLEPGDVLYVPSGVFHDTLAIEPSLHVSYGLVGLNLPHLLRFVLDEWRTQRSPAYTWERIDARPDLERIVDRFTHDLLGEWGNQKIKEFTARHYGSSERLDVAELAARASAQQSEPAAARVLDIPGQ